MKKQQEEQPKRLKGILGFYTMREAWKADLKRMREEAIAETKK